MSLSSMQNVYYTLEDLPEKYHNNTIVIGTFDGVHKGHQKLLKLARQKAFKNTEKVILVTFQSHPKNHIDGKDAPCVLTTLQEKCTLALQYGADAVLALDFNTIKNHSEQDFIDKIIVQGLKAKNVFVGYDFKFGKNKAGTTRTLQHSTEFKTFIIPAQKTSSGVMYSSTNTRLQIKNHNMKLVNTLLGRNYAVHGIVQVGKKIGNTIGFPTANIILDNTIAIPSYGVYAVRIRRKCNDGEIEYYDGVANFGLRPTVGDNTSPQLEIHIFDFSDTLYGKAIQVELLNFIRPEQKFQSLKELTTQIQKDCTMAKAFFKKKKPTPKTLFFTTILGLIAFDQIIKNIARINLVNNPIGFDVLPIFSLNYALNTGVSFSFFSSTNQLPIIVITTLISAFLFHWLLKSQSRILNVGITLILSGAIGNIIDRLHMGGVIDFLSFHYNSYYFPTFNTADFFIFCGVIVIFAEDIYNSIQKKRIKK